MHISVFRSSDLSPHPFAIVLCLFSLLFVTSGCARADVKSTLRDNVQSGRSGPRVLAVYQPWFGEKQHIDVGYHAHDRANIAKQYDRAKDLGIDGFIVNWYGARKPFMDQTYAIMQQIANEKGFKLAIQYDEDVTSAGPTTDKVLVDLRYAYDRYIGDESQIKNSSYLQVNGRPVIFIFPKKGDTDWAEVKRATQQWENPPYLFYIWAPTKYREAFDGFYAWVNPGPKGWQPDGSNWGEEYLDDFYKQMTSEYRHKIAIGAAWPGFDDSKASWTLNRKMDSRCGKTFNDTVRMYRKYFSDGKTGMPFLLVATWNDYEEGTAIERGIPTCTEVANDPNPKRNSSD